MKRISLLIFFLLALPARVGTPDGFTAWKKAVQARFPAKVREHGKQGGCYGKAALEKEYAALFGSWGLRANVKPKDRKLFARISLGVFPLKSGADPAAFLAKVAAEKKIRPWVSCPRVPTSSSPGRGSGSR